MNQLYLLTACLLLPLEGTELATLYEPEATLEVNAITSLRIETTSMTRNGEPVDLRAASAASRRELTWVDTILEAEEGQPTRVRRAFGDVSGSTETEFGENSSSQSIESPFTDAVIEISVEDGEIDVEVVEGDPGDDLDGHVPRLFLDALLPEDEVEAGATWDLETATVRRALGLDLAPAMFPRAEAENIEGRGGRRGAGGRRNTTARWLGQVEWEGEAQLTALDEEHEGMTCARIELTLEAEADLDDLPQGEGRGGGGRGGQATISGSVGAELEGFLLFALEEKRPVYLSLEGSLAMDRTMERSGERGDMVLETEQEGTFSYEVSVRLPQ